MAPVEVPGDAELISAVRAGDVDAYGLLFERHVGAARRLARQLVAAGDVDDLVSEAFAKVLSVLQRGGGPDLAFRAYLLTSVRRLHVDKIRGGARLHTTDDLTPFDPGVPFEDTAVAGFENAAAAKAFASLPERWQQVLWHTEVEGQKPAEIAPMLGMTPNSVSALAYRAREGLRQAFVTMHAQDAVDDECSTTRAHLGAYLRGGLSRRDCAKVEAHLQDCRPCSAIYLELAEVNADLGALLAPILLGTAGAGYLAASHLGAAAAKGGVLLLLDRAKDWVVHNPAGRATGGAAAAAVVALAIVTGLTLSSGPDGPATAPTLPGASAPADAPATGQPPPSAPPDAPPTDTSPGTTPRQTTAPGRSGNGPTGTPAGAPSGTPPRSAGSAPTIGHPLPAVALTTGAASVIIDLTRGAHDADGDRLRVKWARIKDRPAHGTVRIADRAARTAAPGLTRAAVGATAATPARRVLGSVIYTPQSSWRGTETILYALTDGNGGTVRGRVDVSTPNRAPVAVADTAHVHLSAVVAPMTIDVLANDRDPNGDALTVTSVGSVTGSLGGSVTVSSDRRHVVYRPGVGGVLGGATFSYAISDGHGGSATATVTVTSGNTAPVARADAATTPMTDGRSVSVDVLTNDSDPDGDALTVGGYTQPAHGTVTGEGGTLVYTPDPGFPAGKTSGTDSFTYTVHDGYGGTDTATVTVTVASPHSDLAIVNQHVPQAIDHLLSTRFVVSGIPEERHATVTLTVTGLDPTMGSGGWAFDDPSLAACGSWAPSDGGTTLTLVCHLSSADNGQQLGHFDPYADSMTVTVTADDFVADEAVLTVS